MDQLRADELVRAHVRAFNERDLDAFLRTRTEDAVWTTERTTVRGQASMAAFVAGALTGLDAALTVRALMTDGRTATAGAPARETAAGKRRWWPLAAATSTADTP